ncbi:MAG TPA: radical SAM protein [Mariprofundaceae bacterium]|nr:radical SAM protein [Mariprofundaceae bacterium]
MQRIEAANPWLAGLRHARIIEKANADILLGNGLGMLFVELTSRCNERCIHCYADSSPEREEMLPETLARQAIDQAFELGNPYIQFTGGDPLLHPELVELVGYARAKGGPGIEIYTNGLLLHASLLARLVPLSPRLCFSLYSCEAGVHDAITQVPGSHARTLAAIRRTQEAGLEVRIGIALMQQNEATLPATLDFLQHELGIGEESIRIDPVHGTGRGSGVEPARNVRIVPRTSPHNPAAENNGRSGKLAVAASGDIYPCIFSRRILLGNLNRASLPEMLQRLSHRKPAADRATMPDLGCHDCRIIATLLGA